jgi:chemotaxis-related protein WspB
MLFLLFQIGNDRYALDCRHAVEVIPYLALKKLPQAPRGLAGIFNYRGRPIPALDLCELAFDRPARELLSTRIIVVNFTDDGGREQNLGLIAERATGMIRRDQKDFVNTGMKIGAAPYLGPVAMDDQGVIQLLHVQHLLSSKLRELIIAETRVETHEAD